MPLSKAAVWVPIAHAPGYEIFIRTSAGDLRESNISRTSYTPAESLPSGPVRWWIRSSDAIGNRGWSEVGRTTIRSLVLAPAGPTTDTTPTFTWAPVEGAGRYILYVQNLSTDDVVIRQDEEMGTSFVPATGLPADDYRVWVKALDMEGQFSSGRWSLPQDFQITLDKASRPTWEWISLSPMEATYELSRGWIDVTKTISLTRSKPRDPAADAQPHTSQQTNGRRPQSDDAGALTDLAAWMDPGLVDAYMSDLDQVAALDSD